MLSDLQVSWHHKRQELLHISLLTDDTSSGDVDQRHFAL